jgi:hypothetical protein
MYGPQGTGSRGSGVKEVVLLVVFLLVAAFCVGGLIVGDSYLGNPAREQAEAERIRIENRDLEERQQIDRDAYQQQKDNEVQVLKERAQRALLWQDHWNELGMALATAAVVGLLAIAGIRVAIPVAVQAYERYAYRRAQLVEQETRLTEKRLEREVGQAERLREERRLEEVRLQRIRVALVEAQGDGNGRERGFRLEQTRTTSSHKTGTSPTQRHN